MPKVKPLLKIKGMLKHNEPKPESKWLRKPAIPGKLYGAFVSEAMRKGHSMMDRNRTYINMGLTREEALNVEMDCLRKLGKSKYSEDAIAATAWKNITGHY